MKAAQPTVFKSGGHQLVGILHPAADSSGHRILMLVGGPQYRCGAHRLYGTLSRFLQHSGHGTFRFDFAGMGDSAGDFPGFEHLADDVAAAISHYKELDPTADRMIVFGLCDGASAALLATACNPEITGLILVNPWVWSEESESRTFTRHYYRDRLVSRQFWRNLLTGQVNVFASVADFLRRVAGRTSAEESDDGDYQSRMADALTQFSGPVLIILSGQDLVARDFEDRVQRDDRWRTSLDSSRARMVRLPESDHTFSRPEWEKMLAETVEAWLSENSVEQ